MVNYEQRAFKAENGRGKDRRYKYENRADMSVGPTHPRPAINIDGQALH